VAKNKKLGFRVESRKEAKMINLNKNELEKENLDTDEKINCFDNIEPIRLFTGKELRDLEVYLETDSVLTGWYSIDRLRAEGPYKSIRFSENARIFVPEDGPLANTETEFPFLWCAVSEGSLIITDKKDDTPPPVYGDYVKVRGYYNLDHSDKMIWHSIGDAWDENEIAEFRMLSNPSYSLQKRIPVNPQNIFFFGAGASFGSDGRHLYSEGLLPPLGNNLYPFLRDAPELQEWRNIPKEIKELFAESFEKAMAALDKNDKAVSKSLRRDIELSLFFSKHHPKTSNLYWKLARKVARKLRTSRWSGAVVTLNYERLLEESFMRNEVFTVVRGVTFYDDNLPSLQNNQLFEVCYPHGACQFFMGQNWFAGDGDIAFSPNGGGMAGHTGANHILKSSNIPIACEKRQLPLICRYHPQKTPSFRNYFIDTQQNRSQELMLNAQVITIVGVQCLPQNDVHIWTPLAQTKAFLIYVEPGQYGQEQFKSWAINSGKIENKDFKIIPHTFKGAFEEILKFNDLQFD